MLRIQVRLEASSELSLPKSYNHLLHGAIYETLQAINPSFATFLHEEGYAMPASLGDARKRHKLYAFSLMQGHLRKVESDTIDFSPGTLTWHVGSAHPDFITQFQMGLLLASGITLAGQRLRLTDMIMEPTIRFDDGYARFRCLSPIVVFQQKPGERTKRYLRPGDPEFSEAVRQNLISKYCVTHGRYPADDRFQMQFDADYVARKGGMRSTVYRNGKILGAFAPFVAVGAPEMLQMGYYAGFGRINSIGFGMVR